MYAGRTEIVVVLSPNWVLARTVPTPNPVPVTRPSGDTSIAPVSDASENTAGIDPVRFPARSIPRVLTRAVPPTRISSGSRSNVTLTGFPGWMAVLMYANPSTYGSNTDRI